MTAMVQNGEGGVMRDIVQHEQDALLARARGSGGGGAPEPKPKPFVMIEGPPPDLLSESTATLAVRAVPRKHPTADDEAPDLLVVSFPQVEDDSKPPCTDHSFAQGGKIGQ